MTNFSNATLKVLVEASRRDLQEVINAREAAKAAKSPTAHWDARIAQTQKTLQAVTKELEQVS